VHDAATPRANVWYELQCEPGEPGVRLSLNEKYILDKFDLVSET
jgi:hypothetical protein